MSRPAPQPKKPPLTAFTLLELLVSILIVSLLAALLLPSLAGITRRAASVTCANNMRQIGGGILLYAAEHNEQLPFGKDSRSGGGGNWTLDIKDYVGYPDLRTAHFDSTAKVFVCPAARKDERDTGSYFPNRDILVPISDSDTPPPSPIRLTSVRRPSLTVLLLEGYNATAVPPFNNWGTFVGATGSDTPGRLPHGKNPPVPARNATIGDAMNVLYVDGHVQALRLTYKPAPTDYLAYPGGQNNILGPGTTTEP